MQTTQLSAVRQHHKVSDKPLPEIMTAKECAYFLHISLNTFYELVRQNQIPGVVRYGRSIRVLRHVLLNSYN